MAIAWKDVWDSETNCPVGGARTARALGSQASLTCGTLVATVEGWLPVEDLYVGDVVMTFDGGLQPITHISLNPECLSNARGNRSKWSLHVPEGALGNVYPLCLMPEQNILIESDLAESIYGEPFVLMPAMALDGVLGISRVLSEEPVSTVMLGFDNDEIIYVNGSALIMCPAQIPDQSSCQAPMPARDAMENYAVLSPLEAQAVLHQMTAA